LSCRAISCSDNCVCRRRFKSRIACRMVFIAEGLRAGLNPQNNEFFREFRTRRGRELYPRKSNLTFGLLAFAFSVFAVDDLGFRWMHLQVALRQPRLKLDLKGFRFLLVSAMYQPIICIATPWEVRVCPYHPEVKRVVHKDVGQDRASVNDVN